MNAETKKIIRTDYWIYIMLIIIGFFVVYTVTSQMNISGKVVDKNYIESSYHNKIQYVVFVETLTPRGKTRKKMVSVNSVEWKSITRGQVVCLNCSRRYMKETLIKNNKP